jgi:hypothetical protein
MSSRKARNEAHFPTPSPEDLDGVSFLERMVRADILERRFNHAKLRVPMPKMQQKIFLNSKREGSRGAQI